MRNVKRFPFTSLSWHSICIIVFCAQAFALVPHETELAMNRSVIWLCWIRLSFEYLDLIHSRAQITKLFFHSFALLFSVAQLVFTPFKWKSLMRKSWCCKQLSESQILLPLFSKSIKVKLVKKIEALNWNRFPCNAYVLMVVIALLVSVACFSLFLRTQKTVFVTTLLLFCADLSIALPSIEREPRDYVAPFELCLLHLTRSQIWAENCYVNFRSLSMS